MPDLYGPDDFDVAGFAVGVAERRRLVGGARVEAGDAVIGLASSGVHSNGFTLVRRLIERAGVDPADAPASLLAPTVIYAAAVKELMRLVDVRAMAHVTGGGIPGNLPRVLPEGLGARLELATWPRPDAFPWLAALGVEEDEMRRVFNLGLGYLVVVPAGEADEAIRRLGHGRLHRLPRRRDRARQWRRARLGRPRRSRSGCSSREPAPTCRCCSTSCTPTSSRSSASPRAGRTPGARARAPRQASRPRPSTCATTPTARRATPRWRPGSSGAARR